MSARLFSLALGAVVTRGRGKRSQAELGELIGASQAVVSRIEHGRHVPSVLLFGQIAKALGLPMEQLSARVHTVALLTETAAHAILPDRDAIHPDPTWVDRRETYGLVMFVAASCVSCAPRGESATPPEKPRASGRHANRKRAGA